MEPMKRIPNEVAKLIPYCQRMITEENISVYQEAIERLAIALKRCPGIGETDGAKEHPAIFHFFCGQTDIYICEYDKDDTMYGYTILNGDLPFSEWGYTSLSEITRIPPMNIDYHFKAQTIEAALYEAYPCYFKKPESLAS